MTDLVLSEQEQLALHAIAQQTGKTEYDLLHEAVTQFIAQFQSEYRLKLLEQAQGMWQDRDDLSAMLALRQELDRSGL